MVFDLNILPSDADCPGYCLINRSLIGKERRIGQMIPLDFFSRTQMFDSEKKVARQGWIGKERTPLKFPHEMRFDGRPF